ncbi:hypothetical protein GGI35DRAFT_370473 [Trichoderma velutinum]
MPLGPPFRGLANKGRRKLICMRRESRLDCAERCSWRIAVSSLHHVFIAARALLQRGCYSNDIRSTVLEKCWQRNLTSCPILRWTVSATGGWTKKKPKRGIVNRTEPPLAWLLLAGADGKSAQKLVQVSARLLAETWRLDPTAVCGLAVSG